MSDTEFPLADRLLGYNSSDEISLLRAEKHEEIGRTPFERDVDRIKYTSEFRRLKDVTQVARSGETYLYHDRLSHSLKVAQVGRRFAEYVLRMEARSNLDKTSTALEESIELSTGTCQKEIDTDLVRQLDPNIVEAACLAHDLGHPPFGHLAEEELDWLLQEKTCERIDDCEPTDVRRTKEQTDGPSTPDDYDEVTQIEQTEPDGIRFEGNAQSFRILTRLASYRDAETGLGLTVGVLNGVLKYPYGRGEWISEHNHDSWEQNLETIGNRSRGKFGHYKSEQEAFGAVREHIDGQNRTIIAEIMDYADDLTYAIHDLTDFYMDGRLPLDRLLREASEDEFGDITSRELDAVETNLGYDTEDTTPTDVIEYLASNAYSISPTVFQPYEGTTEQRDDLEEFTSFLVETYLNRVYYPDKDGKELEDDPDIDLYLTVEEDENGNHRLIVSDVLQDHVDILQSLTRHYVIQNTALMSQQRGQRQVVRELFEALFDETGVKNPRDSAIPKPYSDLLQQDPEDGGFENESEQRARIVADMIAGMTEIQAVELHKRLTGDAPGSLQNEILR